MDPLFTYFNTGVVPIAYNFLHTANVIEGGINSEVYKQIVLLLYFSVLTTKRQEHCKAYYPLRITFFALVIYTPR